MIDRISRLEAALRLNVALRVRAEQLIAAYIAPGSDRAVIIGELVNLFDGPGQLEAKRLAEAALNKSLGGEEEAPALTARMRSVPCRVWAEVVVGITTGFLCVITLLRPDWIEAFGFDPDKHSGSVEWMIAIASLVVTLALLGAFPWIESRSS
jgi:hypothetical protein